MMSEKSRILVKKAGAFIEPLLNTSQKGRIIGITSKGVFLLFSSRVIFLTSEAADNPFMLQVQSSDDMPVGIGMGQEVTLQERTLGIAGVDYFCPKNIAVAPKPLAHASAADLSSRLHESLLALFRLLNRPVHTDSFLFLAGAILDQDVLLDKRSQTLQEAVLRLRTGALRSDLEDCQRAMTSLVGNGKGLTPSGDDFLCGFLLIKNCLPDIGYPDADFLERLNRTAIELASTRSTWISANMIEAATHRLVDERIGLAVEMVLGQRQVDPGTVAASLESFGNSSGIDAFSGMVAALV
jgi:hypothetical protein